MPTPASLSADAVRLIEAVSVQTPPAPNVASTRRMGPSIYQVKGASPQLTIENLDEEIAKLEQLKVEVTRYHGECDTFQRQAEEQLKTLSIWKPSTWKSLVAEAVDRVLIFLFGPLAGFGTIRISASRVQETRERVDELLGQRKQLEVRALQTQASIRVLDAYSLLQEIPPCDDSYLTAFGERLLQEGLYEYASTHAKVGTVFVRALIGLKRFEEAEQELKKLSQRHISLEIDCLIGLGKIEEAKKAIVESPVYTQDEKTQKILALLLHEKIQKKEDVTSCTPLFCQLNTMRERVLHQKDDEISLEFWFYLIRSEKQAKSVLGGMVEAMKKVAHAAVFEKLQATIEMLNEETKQFLKWQEECQQHKEALSTPALKEALEKAYHEQQEAHRLELLQKKETLEALIAEFKRNGFDENKCDTLLEKLHHAL